MQPQFTAEEVEKHVKGLDASVEVINKLLADNEKTEENKDTMSRNTRHIRIMLAFDSIANSDWDLTAYETAASAGEAWLAS
jgi:hypothetical protein